ncbi:MAG: hypothetical protein ACT4P0_03365 [Panacagrimonas sp.]
MNLPMNVPMNLRCALVAASLLGALSRPAAAGNEALVAEFKAREGKAATVLLQSGAELTGKVAGVAADSVKLTELSGKEFYDAVIALDHVQAVLVRAR